VICASYLIYHLIVSFSPSVAGGTFWRTDPNCWAGRVESSPLSRTHLMKLTPLSTV